MASAAQTATRYFEALANHDLDAAAACWAPDAVDRLVGQRDLIGPEGVREVAARKPSAAWAGHVEPVTGDVASVLHTAAVTV